MGRKEGRPASESAIEAIFSLSEDLIVGKKQYRQKRNWANGSSHKVVRRDNIKFTI